MNEVEDDGDVGVELSSYDTTTTHHHPHLHHHHHHRHRQYHLHQNYHHNDHLSWMKDIGEVEAFAGSQLAAKVVALTALVFTPFS